MKRLIISALAALATFAAQAATLSPVSLINPAGSTVGQAIVSTGPSTAPAWSKVSVAGLAAQAANTVLANVTASSASPTAFAMPSCSTSTSALQYTSGTGFTCYTNSASLAGSTFTGTVSVSPVSGDGALVANSVGGSVAELFLRTAGSNRWAFIRDNSTESGSNSGSNFQITRYNDAGASIDNPFVISRSTGLVTLTNSGTAGSSLAINATGNTGSGAQIFLGGNGATTPNKYIRAFNGAFQIVNSANSATPMSMDDAGNMTLTGTLTATGIAGNTTGTAASAGTLGEVPSATFTSVSMTTTTVQNLTSINLTAGVYLVWGSATYQVGTGATMNIWLAGVSQTTGALPALGSYFQNSGTITATGAATANAPMYLLTLTSAKTIYLTGEAVFSGGAVTATGFLAALRIH